MRQLIEDMATAVTSEQGYTMPEVMDWTWSRLRRGYEQVARKHWDDFIAQATAVEIGVARILGPAFGGKPAGPMPSYEQHHQDPFAEPPKSSMDSPFWTAYRKANKLDEFSDKK